MGVQGGEDIALDQSGQAEIRLGEGAGRVVGGDAAGVLFAWAGIEVDADQQSGPGQIGAQISGCHIVVNTLDTQGAFGEVVRPESDHRGGGGA